MTTAAMRRLVEVRLHGALATRFGRVHWLAVDTAAEAVHALCTQMQELRSFLREWGGPGFRVRVGDRDHAHWRDEATLGLGIGGASRIDLVPVIHGRKRNGWGQVIVGAVLYAVGWVLTAYGYGAVGTPMSNAGLAMMIGGAIALLSPVQKGSDSRSQQEVNSQINGPPNVTTAGGPVPLIIGRMLIGSVRVSSGLSTDQVAITSVDPGTPDLPPEEPIDWNVAPGGGDGSDG